MAIACDVVMIVSGLIGTLSQDRVLSGAAKPGAPGLVLRPWPGAASSAWRCLLGLALPPNWQLEKSLPLLPQQGLLCGLLLLRHHALPKPCCRHFTCARLLGLHLLTRSVRHHAVLLPLPCWYLSLFDSLASMLHFF